MPRQNPSFTPFFDSLKAIYSQLNFFDWQGKENTLRKLVMERDQKGLTDAVTHLFKEISEEAGRQDNLSAWNGMKELLNLAGRSYSALKDKMQAINRLGTAEQNRELQKLFNDQNIAQFFANQLSSLLAKTKNLSKDERFKRITERGLNESLEQGKRAGDQVAYSLEGRIVAQSLSILQQLIEGLAINMGFNPPDVDPNPGAHEPDRIKIGPEFRPNPNRRH